MGVSALEPAMREALSSQSGALALACMDMSSGIVLGMQVTGDASRDELEVAAHSAVQLCAAPAADALDAADEHFDESFVASTKWLHAFARIPNHPDLVVVGLARCGTNVALFQTWIRQVAERVGPHA